MQTFTSFAEMANWLSSQRTAVALMVFRDHGVETWSYAKLAEQIMRLGTGLRETGIRRGEPVLLCAPNSAQWVIAYFAIVCSGGTAVPLDDLSSSRDLTRVLADSGAVRIVTSRSHLPDLEALRAQTALDIVVLDGADEDQTVKDWHELLAESPSELPAIGQDDIASLLYTSGTTGTPKAVPLSHRNLLANLEAFLEGKIAGPKDRVLLPLPLHHSYPFTVGLLGTLASGGTLVLPAGTSGPQITEALKASEATMLIGVPRLYTALLSAVEQKAAQSGRITGQVFRLLLKLSMLLRRGLSVRIGKLVFRRIHRELGPNLRVLGCGGARLDAAAAWKLEALGWEVLTGYGLTETSPILTFNPRGRARIASAGRPLAGVELRIEARQGQRSGEILVRGPNVFSGYRNNPAATKRAFTPDGWFRTGDLGSLDRDGYLHIDGRVKEVIVLPDGKNVIPEDVEDAYASSPLIRDVAILERQGAVAALVVPDDEAIRARGSARAEGLVREELEDISLRLPPHQRISRYRVTHERLPRTHLGKLRRHLLSDIFEKAARAAAASALSELAEEDRRLLASDPAKGVWAWLARRFSGRALALDTSPQLDLHVDSLEWVTLSLEIQDRFGVGLTGDAIARIISIRDLLVEVTAAAGDKRERGPTMGAPTATPDDLRWLRPLGPLATLSGMLVWALNWLFMRGLFRLRVEGVERLPRGGPYVVAPNHGSFLDPLAVAAAVPYLSLRHTYWAGWTGIMFAGPVGRFFSRITRVFPIDPDRGPASGIALGKAVLDRKQILVWFPEGRRSPTGEIRRFLPGIGMLVRQTNAVAVPTLIQGTFEAWPRGRRLPRFRRILVRFGDPVTVSELAAAGSGDDKEDRIASGLQRAVSALQGDPH